MIASNVLKAFRTGVANRSEGDIIEHVLVLEMFQRFSNTQTYLNKQTMSWCKDFLWRHVFLIAFVKLTERCQQATPHLFCVKEWHVNKNHSDDMSRDISLKFVACVCGKSGWALGSIDLVAWTVLCFVKDDVLDANPSRSRGFRRSVAFRTRARIVQDVTPNEWKNKTTDSSSIICSCGEPAFYKYVICMAQCSVCLNGACLGFSNPSLKWQRSSWRSARNWTDRNTGRRSFRGPTITAGD